MSQEAKAFGIVAKFNEEWVETDFNCVACSVGSRPRA